MSNRQLMWFHSCYGPLYKGVIDLHKVSNIKPGVLDDGQRACLEVRALGLRWLFTSEDLATWRQTLLLSLEVCRRHAEAQRLIKMNLGTKQPGWSSRRESLTSDAPEASKGATHRMSCRVTERSTERTTLGTLSTLPSGKQHAMQGFLRLSWIPNSHALGGRCHCTLRLTAGVKETAIFEYSAAGMSQKDNDAALDLADAVALLPTEWDDGPELQVIFADCVLCARADRRDSQTLSTWHSKLSQQLVRRTASPEAAVPAPSAHVLHEGWVCWRSAAVSRTWVPSHCRLYEGGTLEVVQLHRATAGGGFLAHLTRISLGDALEVRRPEIGHHAGCCGLAFARSTPSSTRFEIARDNALEEVDALDANRAKRWVAEATAALAQVPRDDPRQRLIRRCSSNV